LKHGGLSKYGKLAMTKVAAIGENIGIHFFILNVPYFCERFPGPWEIVG
jgi:hypothetical protein